MKNSGWLFLLVFFALCTQQHAFAQTVNAQQSFSGLLKTEDFKLSDGRMVVSDRNCEISRETLRDKVVVSVVCMRQAFNEIGLARINEMILFANDKVSNTLRLEQKYKPGEIRMAYNPESKDWSLTNLFTVEDQNGNIKTNLLAFDFDSSGRFVVMKRVL